MEMVNDIYSKAKIKMFVNEIKRFYFKEQILLLLMICQSVVKRQAMEYTNENQLFYPVKLDTYGKSL